MKTKMPSSTDSVAGMIPGPVVQPDEVMLRFIQGLCWGALGRSATAEEIRDLAALITSAGRPSAVQSVLTMEEALLRLGAPWFWKLLSRGPSEKELADFVGSVRSGTPFDAAISRVVGSNQYIERASKRAIGGDGDAQLLQSIHIDLLGRLADSAEVSRAAKQLRIIGCSRYALGILRSPEFRRNHVVRLYHEVLDRTPTQPEMETWLRRENLGLDLLQVRLQLLAGDEYFDRWGRG